MSGELARLWFSVEEAAKLKAEQELTDEDTDEHTGDDSVTTEALGEEGEFTTQALGKGSLWRSPRHLGWSGRHQQRGEYVFLEANPSPRFL